MRVVLGMGVLVLCLGACGGGGDEGPPPALPAAESLFGGDYFFHVVGGDYEFGPWGWTAWADLRADGAGTFAYLIRANEVGGLSPPWASPTLTYSIGSDRSLRWRPSSDSEWRGGVSADGAVLGIGTHGDAHRPAAGLLVRYGEGLGPTDLMGVYHYAAYGFTLPAIASESRWGSATFDGTSAGSVTWRANTEGAIPIAWVLEPFTYGVSPNGALSLTVTGGSSFTGGLLEGGELAVLSGGTVEDTPPCLWVLLATSTGATASLLDGTYFVAGIELDRSTQFPANRTYTGTVWADGAGGIEPDLRMNEEGTVSGYSPIWTGYTVGADGALEVTTPAGERWVGGVSSSGRFAVFAGDTDSGSDPVLFFLFK